MASFISCLLSIKINYCPLFLPQGFLQPLKLVISLFLKQTTCQSHTLYCCQLVILCCIIPNVVDCQWSTISSASANISHSTHQQWQSWQQCVSHLHQRCQLSTAWPLSHRLIYIIFGMVHSFVSLNYFQNFKLTVVSLLPGEILPPQTDIFFITQIIIHSILILPEKGVYKVTIIKTFQLKQGWVW